MSQSYTIPRSLWESLDSVLFTKSISLARDIAKELGVQPNELIKCISNQERGKFTIIPDDEDAVYQCQALVQHGVLYGRCRCPAFGQTPRFCGTHERHSMDMPSLPLVKKIVTSEATYIVNDKNEVITLNGAIIGRLKGDKLTLFEIEEDSEMSLCRK